MVPSNFYNEYRRNEVSTSSQGKLILMMYDGAINFVKMIKKSVEENNPAQKGIYIRKTHDIINELSCSLDIKKGGEVAAKLENLYQFIIKQLIVVNIKSDPRALESILNILTTLRAGWEQIVNKQGSIATDIPTPLPTTIKSITSRC